MNIRGKKLPPPPKKPRLGVLGFEVISHWRAAEIAKRRDFLTVFETSVGKKSCNEQFRDDVDDVLRGRERERESE